MATIVVCDRCNKTLDVDAETYVLNLSFGPKNDETDTTLTAFEICGDCADKVQSAITHNIQGVKRTRKKQTSVSSESSGKKKAVNKKVAVED